MELSLTLPLYLFFFIENIWKSNLNPLLPAAPTNAMSVEFFNLVFAFASTALRYPAVFWRTNHSFTFTFSLLLALLGVQGLLEANSSEVLVKLCWNNKTIAATLAGLCQASEEPQSSHLEAIELGPTAFEKPAEDHEGLRNALVLGLSFTGTLFMLFLSATVFDYGVEQLVDKMSALRRSAIYASTPQDVAASDTASMTAGGSAVGGVCGMKTDSLKGKRQATVWRRVIAVFGAITVLAIKLPILIACGRAFEVSKQPLLLANIIATAVFFCVWFIAWFAFCLKPDWKFKVGALMS